MLKEELRKLIELQELDKQIYLLREEAEKIPPKIEELKAGFESKKEHLKSLEEELKKSKIDQKNKELELASREEQIKKFQTQLYQIKNNKEYQVKIQEIASTKADCSVIEEGILTVMEQIDNKKRGLEEEKKNVAVEENKVNTETEKLNAQLNDINDKILVLDDQRKNKVVRIEKNVLQDYEHLLHNKGGLAIVPVIDFVCGGCNMSIPPQVVNEIKMYKDITHCGMCARILYVEEDLLDA